MQPPSPSSTLAVDRPMPARRTGRTSRAGRAAEEQVRGRRTVLVVVLALMFLVLARGLLVEPLRIPSESMSPTVQPGQHVLTDKLTRFFRSWQRGDVVVFDHPAGGELLLKRIVAIEGDRVALRDGRLFVNGTRVSEAYADPEDIDSEFFGPLRVPEGEVFVLGDNRAASVDSRSFGTVDVEELQGRVVGVFWPPTDLERVGDEWDPS
jgi:signal peptidase I